MGRGAKGPQRGKPPPRSQAPSISWNPLNDAIGMGIDRHSWQRLQKGQRMRSESSPDPGRRAPTPTSGACNTHSSGRHHGGPASCPRQGVSDPPVCWGGRKARGLWACAGLRCPECSPAPGGTEGFQRPQGSQQLLERGPGCCDHLQAWPTECFLASAPPAREGTPKPELPAPFRIAGNKAWRGNSVATSQGFLGPKRPVTSSLRPLPPARGDGVVVSTHMEQEMLTCVSHHLPRAHPACTPGRGPGP